MSHDAFVLHETKQLAIPRQIDPTAIFGFSDFAIGIDLSGGRQVPGWEIGAGRRHRNSGVRQCRKMRSTTAAGVGSRVLGEIEETTLDEVRGWLAAMNVSIAMEG